MKIPFFHGDFCAVISHSDALVHAPSPIVPGDIVVLSCDARRPHSGDVVFATLADGRSFLRTYHRSGNTVELRAANNFRPIPPVVVDADDVVSYGFFFAVLKLPDDSKKSVGLS